VDWYLDTRDLEAGRVLRDEVVDYLRRHAEPGADVAAAKLVLAELLANAAEHAAGPTWVAIDWSQVQPELAVHDLGSGFEPPETIPPPSADSESGRGLFLVSHLAEDLEVAAKRAGGTTLRAHLPVRRPEQASYDPPQRLTNALPAPEETDTGGGFGREAFLRALVVQLAQAVERTHGPAATEAAIAQVGSDVGGRMEDEYRRAQGIVDRLTPEQISDLYVRLKAGIGGDFYLIEVTDDRIVLGNRACPFGEVVQRAPELCRMTSSVFGGIAARNAGTAKVQLTERIAVGDPECRVTVWLGDDPTGVTGPGHRYTRSS
jgi:anti-sigma regulatory factor (Ser/Thr protein kinase)